MEIKVKIYSCYQYTYTPVYKDILYRIYQDKLNFDNVILEIEDISENNSLNIQQQRNKKQYVTRTIRIYEDNILSHIVAMSNTNYDLDKKYEFDIGKSNKKTNTYGQHHYHGNTYLKQGCPDIFNFYFENKETSDLSFYLLDIDKMVTYPHNLFNVLSYRELETIGFKILNIDKVDFTQYRNVCGSSITYSNIAFPSFNKYIRDISYISKNNSNNTPSFLQCNEDIVSKEDGTSTYLVEKYIYTFKSLSAQGYDSLFRCWCMKILADKENTDIEFRLGKQYFSFSEENKKIADKLSQPTELALKNAGIYINYIKDETFLKEKVLYENTYLKHKNSNQIRNQLLFRNNLRKKNMLVECAICGEDKQSILDAAHIWEINKIKAESASNINQFIKSYNLQDLINQNFQYKNDTFFKKYSLANSGENGVWLCKNHHGLFDNNFFCFDSTDGHIIIHFNTTEEKEDFLKSLSKEQKLSDVILTNATKAFLAKRQSYFEF